jgi:hypothetical protein
MSTRGYVGIMYEGLISFVYNHFDSMPSSLGKYLLNNASTEDQVINIISKGDASSIESGEWFADRGEDHVISGAISIEDYIKQSRPVDYAYLFMDGKWFVRSYKTKEFIELTQEVE